MTESIDFRGWVRPASGELVTGIEQGRARAAVELTLTATDKKGKTTGTDTAQLSFLLAGPPDVIGMRPGAVTRRYPAPGTVDAETTKCPYVELVEPGLPWRYTPAKNPSPGDRKLRPWIVLLVGTEDELLLTGDEVAVGETVQQAHKLAESHRWAHVQDSSGKRTARILSPRPLDADTDYLAVLVRAFAADASGPPADAWTGSGSAIVPVYDLWRFRTGAGGDFPSLAGRLKPGKASPITGSAPIAYPRVPGAPKLLARGALAPVGSFDLPQPNAVASDLAGLAFPPPDPRGRTVLGLPRYGIAWRDDPQQTEWGNTLNSDPRHRGAAGLGLHIGVLEQDLLTDEALRRAGALGIAAQRVRHLSLGLAAASSLWNRRLPTSPMRRLWVLGPTLRRTVGPQGVLADLATADGRPLPRGIFSGAARRILRPGPARTARAAPGAADPGAVLGAANQCPAPDPPVETGVPLGGLGAGDFEQRLAAAAAGGAGDTNRLLAALAAAQKADPAHAQLIGQVLADMTGRVQRGEPLPWSLLAAWLVALQTPPPRRDENEIQRLAALLTPGQPVEAAADLGGLASETVQPVGPPEPCTPVQLGVLHELTFKANPTQDGPAGKRVLQHIEGLDPPTGVPPETCPGMDLPAWRLLNRLAPEWLLPGVGALADDTVIGLQTNPQFMDAFMAGLNTQLLSELRWRNIRVAGGCTPMRVFWDRVSTGSGERVDDLRGVRSWADDSGLGDPQHQPDDVGGTDLVLVIRGQLLLRYPATILSLVSAVHGTKPDFGQDPAPGSVPLTPSFQGRIGSDVLFFGFQDVPATEIGKYWVSLEEPPHGYRFFNNVTAAATATDGAHFADLSFADPVRVLIRGDGLAPGGTP